MRYRLAARNNTKIKVLIITDNGKVNGAAIHGDGHRVDTIQTRTIPVATFARARHIGYHGAKPRHTAALAGKLGN